MLGAIGFMTEQKPLITKAGVISFGGSVVKYSTAFIIALRVSFFILLRFRLVGNERPVPRLEG